MAKHSSDDTLTQSLASRQCKCDDVLSEDKNWPKGFTLTPSTYFTQVTEKKVNPGHY